MGSIAGHLRLATRGSFAFDVRIDERRIEDQCAFPGRHDSVPAGFRQRLAENCWALWCGDFVPAGGVIIGTASTALSRLVGSSRAKNVASGVVSAECVDFPLLLCLDSLPL